MEPVGCERSISGMKYPRGMTWYDPWNPWDVNGVLVG